MSTSVASRPEPPLSPDDALAGFLRELGVDSAALPGDRAGRAARFRSLVGGRRMLILLDNARSAEQVRPLLPGGALDVLDAGGDPHTAVRAVFSWSCQQLSPAAARLFRFLALHPGHDIDADSPDPGA